MLRNHHPLSIIHYPSRRRGFTLIEAALTTVIVGTGVLAIVAAQQAFLQKNEWAVRSAMGMMLANEVRELTLSLPMHDPITNKTTMGPETGENNVTQYDDLDDFAGVVNINGFGGGITFMDQSEITALGLSGPSYQPGPINGLRQVIPNMKGWRQVVTVENVLPGNISTSLTQPLGTTDLMRVQVVTLYKKASAPANEEPMTIGHMYWLVGK